VAYGAEVGTKRLVVVDGKEQPAYNFIFDATLTFSPDSRRIAYMASGVGRKVFLVVDRTEGKPYDALPRDTKLIFFDSGAALHYMVVRMTDQSAPELYLVDESLN
jgi:hypothetical protein